MLSKVYFYRNNKEIFFDQKSAYAWTFTTPIEQNLSILSLII